MAKTMKRESKPKTTKKNTVVKETITNENTIIPAIGDDNDDEPVLVNEKNEIIYDPQEVIDNVMENIESNIPTDFIDKEIVEGFDYIKNNITLPTNLGSDVKTNIDLVERQMEELTKIKDNIMKNNPTNNRSNFNFTSFWNGTTNKW